jgi:hypothetical protein
MSWFTLPDQRMPDDVMWESVQTGLTARITHEFGAAWWVRIAFLSDDIPESVSIRLLHSLPFQPFDHCVYDFVPVHGSALD